jgi:hypothetical protein
MLNLLYNKKLKVMTKNEFLEKWCLNELFMYTNNDFEMTLLSNLSDLQEMNDCNDKEGINIKVKALKEFIMDFYEATPRRVVIDYIEQ